MSEDAPIRVLVVDDHPVFRRGMADVLRDAGFEVVADAKDGEEAIHQFAATSPDVVVSDLDMPEVDGLGLTQKLLASNPLAKVVVLTMHKGEAALCSAVDAGAKAYILKDEPIQGIVDGIKAVAKGGEFVSPAMVPFLMNRTRRSNQILRDVPGLKRLTPTEIEVLKLVARNRMSKEIASDLSISPRTVDRHRNNISRKLELSGKMPLLNWALLHQSEIRALKG